jgi:NAD+ kinase
MKVFVFTRENLKNGAVFDRVAAMFEIVEQIRQCDIVITIGGDGTILRAGKQAAVAGKPLLGINTGRLGFMATLEADDPGKLSRLKSGEFTASRRMLLQVGEHLALNDVVLHREAASHLSEVIVNRADTEVMRFRADGIVIATPTGSTAYSLSAGGPIIEPELECFVATAICPHCLFNRPMVFTANEPLIVSAGGSRTIIDGEEISGAGEVTVTKSEHYLDLIDIDGNSFYNSIHNKLMRSFK